MMNVETMNTNANETNPNQWSWIVGRIIQGFHLIFCICVIIMPYLTNDLFWLCALVINNTIIILLWYLYNGCFVNTLENWILGNLRHTNEDGNEPEKSFILDWMVYLFGETVGKYIMTLCTCIPAFNTVVCIWKIYGLKMGNNPVIIDTTTY